MAFLLRNIEGILDMFDFWLLIFKGDANDIEPGFLIVKAPLAQEVKCDLDHLLLLVPMDRLQR